MQAGPGHARWLGLALRYRAVPLRTARRLAPPLPHPLTAADVRSKLLLLRCLGSLHTARVVRASRQRATRMGLAKLAPRRPRSLAPVSHRRWHCLPRAQSRRPRHARRRPAAGGAARRGGAGRSVRQAAHVARREGMRHAAPLSGVCGSAAGWDCEMCATAWTLCVLARALSAWGRVSIRTPERLHCALQRLPSLV